MPGYAGAVPEKPLNSQEARRQRWLSALACASSDALARAIDELGPLPPHQLLRPPETGMIMLRGRAGGTGRRFNVGEATVTRCTVRIEEGAIGHGYVLGRDVRHAEHMALLDALLQDTGRQGQLWNDVIEPLFQARSEKRATERRRTAGTRVEFFTMVRGED